MRVLCIALIILLMLPVFFIQAQAQSDFPTITVNYRELRLVPDDFDGLKDKHSIFTSEPSLEMIVNSNSTLFWQDIGPFDSNFSLDMSFSTFAIVHINTSGFFQYLVMLSPDNRSLCQTNLFQPDNENEFAAIIETATDFFASNDHYWGLCEEIIVIPGSLENIDTRYLWRLTFHLVAEGERWTLLINSTASIVSMYSEVIPCQSCSNPLPVIVESSSLIVIGLVVVYVLFRKNEGHSKSL